MNGSSHSYMNARYFLSRHEPRYRRLKTPHPNKHTSRAAKCDAEPAPTRISPLTWSTKATGCHSLSRSRRAALQRKSANRLLPCLHELHRCTRKLRTCPDVALSTSNSPHSSQYKDGNPNMSCLAFTQDRAPPPRPLELILLPLTALVSHACVTARAACESVPSPREGCNCVRIRSLVPNFLRPCAEPGICRNTQSITA